MIFMALLLAAQPAPAAAPPAPGPVVTTASGLRLQVLRPGSGRRPVAGDAVEVTFEARLADGTLVDSAAQPVGLAVSGLIPGFTEALLLMNQGGEYRFWVPPELGYAGQSVRDIVPRDAELVFTLTLVRVGRPATPR